MSKDTLRLSSFGCVALRDSLSVTYKNTLLAFTIRAPVQFPAFARTSLEIRRVCSALFVSSFVGLQSSHALKTLPIADQQTSQIEIAQKEFTRLTVKDDRIKQIFGGTQDLTIEVDEEIGQIFIKPLEGHTRPIRMTLITESGLTHDLKLIPHLQESESILFMAGQASAEKTNTQPQVERIEEILTMIKKLASNTNERSDNAVQSMEDRCYEGLSLKLINTFNEGQITGYTYEITNITESSMDLVEEVFCLPGDMAVCVLQTHLEPGKTTELFIVRKEENEDRTPSIPKKGDCRYE